MTEVIGKTDKGVMREKNEDRFAGSAVREGFSYGIVCDGMGGAKGGAIASSLACEEARRVTEQSARPRMDAKSAYLTLRSAVDAANYRVYRAALQDTSLSGMGTTLCMAVVCGDVCYYTNVGDSRLYLFRRGRLTRLTKDHSVVQMLVDEGTITEEEAQYPPERNCITRVVGVHETVYGDSDEYPLEPGDALLLCSDGLYTMLPGAKLEALTARALEKKDCSPLIEAANEMGGADNITAVLMIYGKEG